MRQGVWVLPASLSSPRKRGSSPTQPPGDAAVHVIPAQAGIQWSFVRTRHRMDSRFRGNDRNLLAAGAG